MSYLVDKSAWEQRHRSATAEQQLIDLMAEGQACTCQVILLEFLYSAHSADNYQQLQEWLQRLPLLPTGNNGLFQALDIQKTLADRGQHRAPSLPDLIIAATALEHEATILHYDKDFDLIADATGQPTEWILPRGTT